MTLPTSSTISTTTSFSKVRGFTVDLLFHLKNRELRVIDLVELTGKSSQYVRRYLINMWKYGLTEKNGSFWKLSEDGVSFLSYLESLPNNNIIIRKNKERIKKDERKNNESCVPKKLKQSSIALWLNKSSLDDAEKVVVEVLVDHYNRTGSKFLYFSDIYEIAERFKIRPDQVNKVFMNLKQDRIVYNYRDRSHDAWKIGLYKAFVHALERGRHTKGSRGENNVL